MKHSQMTIVEKTVEIVKEYARSDSKSASVPTLIEQVYEALNKINVDTDD